LQFEDLYILALKESDVLVFDHENGSWKLIFFQIHERPLLQTVEYIYNYRLEQVVWDHPLYGKSRARSQLLHGKWGV
jgi:hypothetical protein